MSSVGGHFAYALLFSLEIKIMLRVLTSVSHILAVSNYLVHVCLNDEIDLWPVYSGERFRAS